MAFWIPLAMMAASAAAAAMKGKAEAGDPAVIKKPPKLEELRAQLVPLVLQGVLSPEQAETIMADPSAYTQIEEDPTLRGRQVDALSRYGEIAEAGGLDAQARAGIADALTQQQTASRGASEAIMANARARGQGGTDLEFVNRLLAQQGAAQRGSQAALTTAAEGQRRRDVALAAMADVAGGVRSQDYQKAATEAAAVDQINRFNTANQQQQANLNTTVSNAAAERNLQEQQRISDANLAARNNLILPAANLRQNFNTQQITNTGQANAATTAAQASNNQLYGGLLSTAGQIGSAYATSDERAKTEVRDLSPGELLDEITGKKFRYRPGRGEPTGQMAGVMAQDVERAAPGAVAEGPDGMKRVDVGQLGGLMLAALADVHQRLKNVEGRGNG